MSDAVLSKWKARAAEADANRETFAFATQMLDELRAEGFEKARVTFAQNPDGRTIGQRSPEAVTPIVEPPNRRFFLYEKHDLIARKREGRT